MSTIERFIDGLLQEQSNRETFTMDSGRGTIIDITEGKPWSSSLVPVSIACSTSDTRFAPSADGKNIVVDVPNTDKKPILTEDAMKNLSNIIGVPNSVFGKISNGLGSQVLNEISASINKEIQFTGRPETDDTPPQIYGVSPGWRETCSHSEIAEIAWRQVSKLDKSTVVDYYVENGSMMTMRLGTSIQQTVTDKVGDVLGFGINIEHVYGRHIDVSMFLKRLVCLNGMIREVSDYKWNNKGSGDVADQLDYVIASINDSFGLFEAVSRKAIEMAATNVNGEPREALIQRVRAMGIPNRYIPDIMNAFEAEPGNTEWHMLNAVTRFATHTLPDIDPHLQRKVWAASGSWTSQFDMVTARLPRPIAERIGAAMIEE